MTSAARLLVVDDEPQIRRVLRVALMAQGFEVRTAADGEEALDAVRDFQPSLVITDLSMPNLDGLALTTRLRQRSTVPIIVLSVKGEEATKVRALDAGADDYVTKPFGMDELLARIRVALRRQTVPAAVDDVILAGAITIDVVARAVSVNGEPVHLTPKEFDLLLYMARNAGKVLTHRALLGEVWGATHTTQTEYLRVFIGQLRKKIEADPARPRHLLTEPWVGYRFVADGA